MFAIQTGGLRSFSLMFAVCLTPLGGCAVVDQYGSRAIEYNEQAAMSKSSAILLNIMRAAYRQPFQFTDLSTVTGTASAQGSISASIPFKDGGLNLTGPRILTLNPMAQVSGGPQFNIANLNSQEFYQGFTAPIETQIIATYLKSGIPLKVLLPIFISDIEVGDAKANKKYLIHNGVLTLDSYNDFLTAIESLVDDGLDIEPQPSDEKIGPALAANKASDPRLLAGLVQAMATASSTGGPSFKFEEKGKRFQLSKKGDKWRFCFRSSVQKRPFNLDAVTYTDLNHKNFKQFYLNIGYSNGKPDIAIPVTRDLNILCGSPTNGANSTGTKLQVAPNLYFTPRSVEGIFLFLGEMARTQLGIDSGVETPIADPNGGPDRKFIGSDLPRGPKYLFKVERRPPSYGEISANFFGTPYTISVDPSGNNASSQVVEILTDLLALQSSAKSLPAPNVISVIP